MTFQDIFNIQSENYIKIDEIWGNVDGSIMYGFGEDWHAYKNVLNIFFISFSILIIVFVSPLFTYDRECNMSDYLGTSKNGVKQLFICKVGSAFITVNILMLIFLVIISIFYFSYYGFENANVSIQCSYGMKYVNATISCTMGQLIVVQLLFGIMGCNMILLVTVFISMISKTSLEAFAKSIIATWIFSYIIINRIIENDGVNLFLSLIPINGFFVTDLIDDISSWYVLWGVFIIRYVLFFSLFLVTIKIWNRDRFMNKEIRR